MSSPVMKKSHKPKNVKILLLGQSAVGKTALTVRYITKRFIGEYDPTLEKIYSYLAEVDGQLVTFEILDTAGQDNHNLRIEENIRWADACILMYSITDRVSFEECTRLKFLVNHAKKTRKSSTGSLRQTLDMPVCLVGNKIDLIGDRMVQEEEGTRLGHELNCSDFYEISVRESYGDVKHVFDDTFRHVRFSKKPESPKLQRNISPPGGRRRVERSGISTSVVGHVLTSSDEMDLKDGHVTSPTQVTRSSSISKRIYQKVFKKETSSTTSSIANLYLQTT